MPFLATNGRQQFSETRGTAVKHHNHHRRIFLQDVGSGVKSTSPDTLSIPARATVVTNGKDQAQLAEKCDVLLKRGKEDQGPDNTIQSPSKPTVSGMRRKREYAGESNGGRSRLVLL